MAGISKKATPSVEVFDVLSKLRSEEAKQFEQHQEPVYQAIQQRQPLIAESMDEFFTMDDVPAGD
jgi:hypothetical protein